MAYIGKEPIVGNFQKCDAITVVNGQAAYTLQVSSTNVTPESSQHCLVSLNGILQAPVTSFTVSGSTLTFASNLATGDVIDFVILLGAVLNVGTVSDATITNAKLAQDIISGETALASEPADTDEFLVSDAGTLKRIDYSLIKAANTPIFHITDAGQDLSDNTWTKITFDTEVIDTDSAFASSKFTVPSGKDGYYLIGGTHRIENDTGRVLQQFYKNGSAVNAYWETNGTSYASAGQTIILNLSAGDYIEYYAFNAVGNTNGTVEYNFYGFKLI